MEIPLRFTWFWIKTGDRSTTDNSLSSVFFFIMFHLWLLHEWIRMCVSRPLILDIMNLTFHPNPSLPVTTNGLYIHPRFTTSTTSRELPKRHQSEHQILNSRRTIIVHLIYNPFVLNFIPNSLSTVIIPILSPMTHLFIGDSRFYTNWNN